MKLDRFSFESGYFTGFRDAKDENTFTISRMNLARKDVEEILIELNKQHTNCCNGSKVQRMDSVPPKPCSAGSTPVTPATLY